MRIDRIAAASLLIGLVWTGAAWPQDSDKLFQRGWSRTGDSYQRVEKGSARRCQDACIEEAICRAWVFETATESCRLMSQSPPVEPQRDACCTTGVKQN